MCGGVHDVITGNKFHQNRLRGFRATGSENWGLPLTWPVALTTVQHYRADCDHILAISHRNAFICIYSNFSPKIGCHGNAILSLVYWSVNYEFPMAQTLSQNQTLYGYVAYNWSYGHFCDFLAYFGQNLITMATPLRPLQSEMSSDWSTTKTPCYK